MKQIFIYKHSYITLTRLFRIGVSKEARFIHNLVLARRHGTVMAPFAVMPRLQTVAVSTSMLEACLHLVVGEDIMNRIRKQADFPPELKARKLGSKKTLTVVVNDV